jgi:glycosyltransferase involved in cell wall biosynthesis
MKILILGSKEYPFGSGNSSDTISSGGIERYIENLVGELAQYPDLEMLIITRRFLRTPPFQKIKNIKIYRVGWIKGFFFRNPTFNLNAFLISLFLNFDLVFCVGVVASFFGVILSFLKRVPVVHHFAGIHHLESQYNYLVKRIIYTLEVLAYRFRGDMIFLSDENEQKFKFVMGFVPPRTHIIPTGIDVKYFSPPAMHEAKPPLRLITVGRLIEVKGIQDLLKALSILKDKIDFVCLIVGDGPYRGSLEKIAEGYSLKGRVIFKGNVSPERVVNILRSAHIYVLPSYSEGLPQSLLEAMACGLPCIVTDIGLPIKQGDTGLIVSPSDTKAMADAILRLSAAPSFMVTLGRNAREYVVSNHSREGWAEKIYQISKTIR